MGYNVTKGNSPVPTRAKRFQKFDDLEVYKSAREFRKAVCAVSRCLPDFEKYEVGREIRRAAEFFK